LLFQALVAYNSGEILESIELFNAIIQKYPNFYQIYDYLALASISVKKYKIAGEYLTTLFSQKIDYTSSFKTILKLLELYREKEFIQELLIKFKAQLSIFFETNGVVFEGIKSLEKIEIFGKKDCRLIKKILEYQNKFASYNILDFTDIAEDNFITNSELLVKIEDYDFSQGIEQTSKSRTIELRGIQKSSKAKIFKDPVYQLKLKLYGIKNCYVNRMGMVCDTSNNFYEFSKGKAFKNLFDSNPNNIKTENRSANELSSILILKLFHRYYHWTTECLSSLAVLLLDPNLSCKIILPYDIESYKIQSLKLAGLEERIQYFEEEVCFCDEIIYNPMLYKGLKYMDFSIIKVIYDRIIDNSLKTLAESNLQVKTSDLIYIARFDADRRKLLNEEQLAYQLEKLSFKIVTLSDKTLAEQVQLFHTAKVVVGPHGAGLSNLVYSRNNPTLVELFPSISDQKVYLFFANICRSMGLDHWMYRFPFIDQQKNWQVDIDVTMNLVEKVLKHQEIE
jgi:capsular polysaccharide biosynthesis protein